MLKKSLLIFFIGMILINLVNAAYYGSYRNFSLSDLLDEIDPSTMILGAVFLVSLVFLNFSLGKYFKDENKKLANILSLVIAFFITWSVNKSGLDFEGLFYDLGFSADFLYTFLPLLFIGALLYMGFSRKFGWGKALVIIGVTLLGISFFVYEKGAMVTMALFFIIGGIIIWMKQFKKPKLLYHHPPGYGRNYSERASFMD